MIKSPENMTFNGVNLAESFTDSAKGTYFIVNNVDGRGVLGEEIETIEVPGMAGAYQSSKHTPVRELNVSISMKGESFEDLRKQIDRLSAILVTDKPAEITFADEPGTVYYGSLANVEHTLEVSGIYQAVLTFLCVDPFKYGEEQSYPFSSVPMEEGVGRNLVIRTGELKNTWIDIEGNVVDSAQNTATMAKYIPVSPRQVYTFSKGESDNEDGGFWRWRYFDENSSFLGREAESSNEFQWIIPDGAYYVQVSYPSDADPKLEKGNIATPWTPAPEDRPSDILTLNYDGTAPSSPIFELEVKEPVTFAMIQNQLNEYMMVGKPFDLNQIPAEKYPRLLRENGSDLTGWTYLPGGEPIDDGILGGIVGGSIKSNGYAFYADKFGDNPNGWVGPAIRRSFSESKQDFKITADLASLNKGGGVGKIVVALLDANDNIVASMGVMDPTNAYDNNKVYFRVGGRQTIHEEGGAVYKVYNNSRVYLEMTRVGKNFNVRSYERLEDGTLTSRSRNKFVDDLNRYQAPIQQVVIYIAKAKTYRTFPMFMHGLSVFGINDISQDQIPYIAYPDDIIRFDTKNYAVYINGVPHKEDLAIGSTFFNLYKGDNQLIVSPQEAFNTKVIYRDTHR